MPESLRRVQELTGCSVEFEEMDILDQVALQCLFKKVSAGGWAFAKGKAGEATSPTLPCSTTLRLSSTSRGSRPWASQCRSLWIITELT